MKFKVLVHGNIFVNEKMLTVGIYETDRPKLHLPETTMVGLVNKYNESWYFATGNYLSDDYLNNLNNCQLIDVTLQIDNNA